VQGFRIIEMVNSTGIVPIAENKNNHKMKIFYRLSLVILLLLTVIFILFPLGFLWLVTGKDYYSVIIDKLMTYFNDKI
jgi:hypothetical protein